MIRTYLALGGNLGDRERFLDLSVLRLRAIPGLTIRRVSSYYETAPVGGPPNAGDYLNAVAEADTQLSPEQLLSAILTVERQLGRVRSVPNAPRTVDLDVLAYGDLVRTNPELILPHPRMHQRRFVLDPLVELNPDWRHPLLQKTAYELQQELPPEPVPPRPIARTIVPAIRDLSGQRALVTGSTSGIGLAIATKLAQAGADVLIHGRQSAATAEAISQRLLAYGTRTGVVMANLADANGWDSLADSAWNHWQGLDIVVLNAGADLLTGEAPEWSFQRKWTELLAVDLSSTVMLGRAFGERMKHQGHGNIITMGWDQAETGFAGDSGQLFGPVKAAVMAFTRSLAKSLAPEVRVNGVAPGWIKTAWGEQASPKWQQRVETETPLRRWGLPEDIAQAVHFLVSPQAGFITGQILRINGGAV